MGFGRNPILKRQFDSAQDGLFVMVQNQGEDLDHFSITAGPLEQPSLQLPEGFGHLEEGGTITQSPGLALDHRQIMPPVVNCRARSIMGAGEDALMLAHDLPFGDDDDALGIDPYADGTIGEGCGHAVTIAL